MHKNRNFNTKHNQQWRETTWGKRNTAAKQLLLQDKTNEIEEYATDKTTELNKQNRHEDARRQYQIINHPAPKQRRVQAMLKQTNGAWAITDKPEIDVWTKHAQAAFQTRPINH